MSHSTHHEGDRSAAFVGLVAGGITIFAILFAIVVWTNHKFASHAPASAPAPGAATTPASTH